MKTTHISNKAGIYKITNTLNGKVYIGSTVKNLRHRINRHVICLENDTHHSKHFQESWNKHGKSNFVCAVIEEYPTPANREFILSREQYYLDLYKPFDHTRGYNVCEKAGSPEHRTLSKEHRKKISQGLIGRKWSLKQRRNLSKALTGRKMPPGYGKRMSKIKTGLKQTKECVDKRAKYYSFIDSTGAIYQGKNLKRFAEQHGLFRYNLNKVLSGERKSHHGFKKYQPTN